MICFHSYKKQKFVTLQMILPYTLANGFLLHAGISALKKGSENALEWLKINSIAANPVKFQIMFLGMPENSEIIIDISFVALKSSPAVKLLGVVP